MVTSIAAQAAAAPAAGSEEHPWMLVAPWWHWPSQTGHGRTSHPALQKYETSDLVNTFLADPQLRLKFLRHVDEVVAITPVSSPLGSPVRTPTGVRKLYLDTHHRHYLVTCELHCDATGFPPVTRDQVCQAGFVIRRRLFDVPIEERAASRTMLRRLASARQRLASAEAELATARLRQTATVHARKLEARREAAASLVAQHQAVVRDWASAIGLRRRLEGWIPQGIDPKTGTVDMPACPAGAAQGGASPPAPLAGVGRWKAVEELPADLAEGWFPLRPLIADPTNPVSDAAGATIYYGLVPTGSADVDPNGTARFDDDSTYEIRCFVRRHKAACPLTGPQCHCPITWSDPAESYRIAPHFDLRGTANRPVTMQLPDLDALQSDALTLPPGSTGGVIMKAPQRLMPTATFPPGGSRGGAEICTFSIPLITIVATFVFNLFLPIVILIFQLWFMLLLKFCIPPEVQPDATFEAALAAAPPSGVVSATLNAEIDSGFDEMMSGANLGPDMTPTSQDRASQVLTAKVSLPERMRLAKMVLSGSVNPVPPDDLVFAKLVDRSQAVP
jgi:hypothetical protein